MAGSTPCPGYISFVLSRDKIQQDGWNECSPNKIRNCCLNHGVDVFLCRRDSFLQRIERKR